MPVVGFGTAGLGPETAERVADAMDAGYTMIDTAEVSPARTDGTDVGACARELGADDPQSRLADQQPTIRLVYPHQNPHTKITRPQQARDWYRQDLVIQGLLKAGKPRESIFIVSKLHPRDLGVKASRAAFERTLKDLQTDYIDLWVSWVVMCVR